ncbi:hypothetical protein [Cryptosporangium arvum]|uniref:hypothetical protein n=1 Tax=Cryptosporangium arvum TaxID=80871 RepID=UPI00055BCACB|nr:hypothetical protein [Cryptosporangium arvum]
MHTRIDGEDFDLPDHSAHDLSRFDVIKDVRRVESLVAAGLAHAGCSLTLTNDPLYWQPARRAEPRDKAFHLHDQRTLSGTLAWPPDVPPGSIAGREAPLDLTGTYRLHWQPYSTIENAVGGRGTELRYLAVSVSGLPAAT